MQQQIFDLLLTYKYVIMVPLATIAQPIVGIAAGLLSRLGYMEFWIAFLILLATALLNDVVWYWLGYHYGDRFVHGFGRYIGLTTIRIENAKKIFFKYHTSILLISKISNGLGFAIVVMFTAGLTRVSIARFLTLNAIGESAWSALLLYIGYQISDWYLQANTALGRISLVSLFGIFVIIAALVGHYVANRIRKGAS